MNQVMSALQLAEGDMVVPFSSITGEGKDKVWNIILNDLGIEAE